MVGLLLFCAGFDDVDTLKTDPDLSTIRGRELDEVIAK